MKRWFWLAAGLLIWATHFIGLYLISSAADVWSSADAMTPRLIGLGFSLACLLVVGGAAACLWHRRAADSEPEAWEGRVGLTGALVATIGIVWQMMPLAF